MSEFLNDITMSKEVYDFTKERDALFLNLGKTPQGVDKVLSESGFVDDQRSEIFCMDGRYLKVSPRRSYTTTTINSFTRYTFGNYVGSFIFPLSEESGDNHSVGSLYGIFPVSAGDYSLGCTVNAYNIVETATVKVRLEYLDASKVKWQASVAQYPWVEIDSAVLSFTSAGMKGSSTFLRVTEPHTNCRIVVEVENCCARLFSIYLNASDSTLTAEKSSTVLQSLYNDSLSPTIKVYCKTSKTQQYWSNLSHKGVIDDDSIRINYLTNESNHSGVFGKELTFKISHEWRSPYINFMKNYRIRVTAMIGGMERVLFEGVVDEESIDKVFYSTSIRAVDYLTYAMNQTGKVFYANGKKLTPDELYQLALRDYKHGDFRGFFVEGRLPEGEIYEDGVMTYKGDQVVQRIPTGTYTPPNYAVYRYKFPSKHTESGVEQEIVMTQFDGKTYTPDALKEYIKNMSPSTILSKANGSDVVKREWIHRGPWVSGRLYDKDEVVQDIVNKSEGTGIYKHLLSNTTSIGNIRVYMPYDVGDDIKYIISFMNPEEVLTRTDGSKLIERISYDDDGMTENDPYKYKETYMGNYVSGGDYMPGCIVAYKRTSTLTEYYKYVYPLNDKRDCTVKRYSDMSVEIIPNPSGVYALSYRGNTTYQGQTLSSINLRGYLMRDNPSLIYSLQGEYKYVEKLDVKTWTSGEVYEDDQIVLYNNTLYRYKIPKGSVDLGKTVASTKVNELIKNYPRRLLIGTSTGNQILEEINSDDIFFTTSAYNYTGDGLRPGAIIYSQRDYRYYKASENIPESVMHKYLSGTSAAYLTQLSAYSSYFSVIDPKYLDLWEPPRVPLNYSLAETLKLAGVDITFENEEADSTYFINGGLYVKYSPVGGSLSNMVKGFCELNMVFLEVNDEGKVGFKVLSNGVDLTSQPALYENTPQDTYSWDKPTEVILNGVMDLTTLKTDGENYEIRADTILCGEVESTHIYSETQYTVKLDISSNFFSSFIKGNTWDEGKYEFDTGKQVLRRLHNLINSVNKSAFVATYKASIKSRMFLPIDRGSVATIVTKNGVYLLHMHVKQKDMSLSGVADCQISS